MSDTTELISRLQTVMKWELAGTIQYLHHSAMLMGVERLPYTEFFKEGSEEAREHAELVATKIPALGGMPAAEPAQIRLGSTLEETLLAALALEVDALAAWEAALEVADSANLGTQFWIEEMIAHEQEHVDELRKLTGKISIAGAAKDASSQAG